MKSFRLYRGSGGVRTLLMCGTQGVLALFLSLPASLLSECLEWFLLALPGLAFAGLTFGIGHAVLAVFCLVSARQAWGEIAPLWARVATVVVDVLGAAAAVWFTVAWVRGS